MTKLNKTFLFLNLAFIAAIITVGAVLAWTGPSGAPPAGSGLFYYSGGNVGIGTQTPGYKFDVQGGQINASGGLCMGGDCKTTWPAGGGSGSSLWATSGTAIYNTNSGNVGIGTADPSTKLHISGGNVTIGSTVPAWLDGAVVVYTAGNPQIYSLGNSNPGINFWDAPSVTRGGRIYIDSSGHMVFDMYSGGGWPARLYIQSGGNVGIGTTTPAQKLSVAGTVESTSGGFKFPDGTVQATAASGGGGGKMAQSVYYQTGAYLSGATAIPADDTIPQKTEGDEYLTVSITPKNVANVLTINVHLFVTRTVSSDGTITVALFQDAAANALAAVANHLIAGHVQQLTLVHHMVAGTTSPITFKVRAGSGTAVTMYVNGIGTGRLFGGAAASSIDIQEIEP